MYVSLRGDVVDPRTGALVYSGPLRSSPITVGSTTVSASDPSPHHLAPTGPTADRPQQPMLPTQPAQPTQPVVPPDQMLPTPQDMPVTTVPGELPPDVQQTIVPTEQQAASSASNLPLLIGAGLLAAAAGAWWMFARKKKKEQK